MFHFFGSVASGPSIENLTLLPLDVFTEIATNRSCSFRCGVVRIAIGGPEVQRCADPAAPIAPLPDTFLATFNPLLPPAATSFSLRSQLKVMVVFYDDTPCPRRLCFDVGQTIELVTDCVSVIVVHPNTVRAVGGPQAASERASGLVIDAFIKAAIWEAESPIGALGGHCTDTIVVPAGAQVCVPVPDGAQEVQIFQSSVGVAASFFSMFYGNPSIATCAVEHGLIMFEPGLRETPIKRVGRTTHLCSDIDIDDERVFTLVWRIEP